MTRLREDMDRARRAFQWHEVGMQVSEIMLRLDCSRSNAVNLIGLGRRLAADLSGRSAS